MNAVQRASLACRIRRNSNEQVLPITLALLEHVRSENTTYNPFATVNDIIRYIGDEISSNGVPVKGLSGEEVQQIICSPSIEIVKQMMGELAADDGFISFVDVSSIGSPGYRNVNLTLRGWERYSLERRGQLHGNFGFIAMKFFDNPDDDGLGLPKFVEQIVKPVAKEATGYDLYDIRHFQQSGVIDNYLRATIRDAAFVVCDLTHDNHGAYWEAGYADALDKPVIYICEKTKFATEQSHFDTNHCTTIVWQKDSDHSQFRQNFVATLRRSLKLFD